MRDLDENSITTEALSRVSAAPDPRMRQISEALIRHLHTFIREIEPTQAEWEAGIGFLTRVGQMCNANRQEFILLSDALGVSMLVDAINHRMPEGATETTVFGPFFVQARKSFPLGANIAEDLEGTPMLVTGTVSSTSGAPLTEADIDVWHSDDEGYYDVQQGDELAMRGHFRADDEGRFHFWSVRPRYYPIPDDGPVGDMLKAQGRHPFRPEHVHFMVAAAGHETLVTHVFAEGDPYLDSDVVFGVKNSLVTRFVEHEAGTAADGRIMNRNYVHLHYDFVLKARPPSAQARSNR
ncbi:intradiol ring-cleavage dioxygenase [Sinorhizobium meliloti]|uniref:intradiol ring-cleavage dioxygenase n=1 Tax=Rhizobium meliloti TaxID=382 RepID=UPI00028619E1|nr:intradiol ring-cleavage dioxygenase [Sinorhizobium meliloti]ASP83126.1 hydroxyquinol 1,2-dioxygenase [Sinorhizobium meliloti]MQW20102.1 hydroxyquinol 1,2-dioxygenase [Sinorhizobium meliloti]CCM69649.1 Hydroxyquinol 1,2-dioxygenase [Sinorhizobium meliloti Rm41]